MKQLTKKELQNLDPGQIIVEKSLNINSHLLIETIEIGKIPTFHMINIKSKKRSKMVISENFNKEGDRKYKSKIGSIIIKYYRDGDD